MEVVIKNVWGVTIVSKEIDCADNIVHETGIYKAIVVSTRESECFLNIEVERLSLLIVTLQSKETSDCDSSIRQLILYCGCLPFKYDGNFEVCLHFTFYEH